MLYMLKINTHTHYCFLFLKVYSIVRCIQMTMAVLRYLYYFIYFILFLFFYLLLFAVI